MWSRWICPAMTGRRALRPMPTWFALLSMGATTTWCWSGTPWRLYRSRWSRLVDRCGIWCTCARSVPDIGRSLADQLRDEADMLNPLCYAGLSEPDAQLRRAWVDLEVARALLFADCDDPVAEAALNRLRPQATYPYTLPCSLSEFPAVRCTSVVCTDDQFIGPEWSRRTARDRLGAELIELPGSHSPFLSRPKALADVLLRLAGQ